MRPAIKPFAGPEHQPFRLGEGLGGVLLIHGFPGTPAEVRPIGEALVKNGWHTRGILLPGFGPDIVNLDRYSRKDWLRAAQTEWEDLRASHRPRALLGYSMGGAIALNLAQRLPADKLVLLAPFWCLPGILPRLVPLVRLITPQMRLFEEADFDNSDTREQFHWVMPGIDLDDPEVQAYIRTEVTLPLGAIQQILRLGREAYRLAKHVTVPTLVIQGVDDQLVHMAQTRKLVRRLGSDGVTYCEIEGDHDLPRRNPEIISQVSKLVIDFLGTQGHPLWQNKGT